VDKPRIQLTALKKQLPDSRGDFSLQNPASIFWDEYYMDGTLMESVGVLPEKYFLYFGHILTL